MPSKFHTSFGALTPSSDSDVTDDVGSVWGFSAEDLSLVLKQCALSLSLWDIDNMLCCLSFSGLAGTSQTVSQSVSQCSSAAQLSVVIWAVPPHQQTLCGETSPLQNALTALYTCRCHGKALSPNMDYSYRCLQARAAATSCRKEPHIQGQFPPPGNILTQQILSHGRLLHSKALQIKASCWSDLVFYFRLLLTPAHELLLSCKTESIEW